jgi:hypothetical protein
MEAKRQQPCHGEHTFCVTCHSTLPPNSEIHYFVQSRLHPEKDDLDFSEEIHTLLLHLKALLGVMGYDNLDDPKDMRELARLGHNVTQEALRRMDLLRDAQDILWTRYDRLKKKYGVTTDEEVKS